MSDEYDFDAAAPDLEQTMRDVLDNLGELACHVARDAGSYDLEILAIYPEPHPPAPEPSGLPRTSGGPITVRPVTRGLRLVALATRKCPSIKPPALSG